MGTISHRRAMTAWKYVLLTLYLIAAIVQAGPAVVRLKIGLDGDAFNKRYHSDRGKVNKSVKTDASSVNRRLKREMGLVLQIQNVVIYEDEFAKSGSRPDSLLTYFIRLESKIGLEEDFDFFIMLTDFIQFTTDVTAYASSSPGRSNDCHEFALISMSRNGMQRNTLDIRRDMMQVILHMMGLTNEFDTCICQDCIIDQRSNSSHFTDCIRNWTLPSCVRSLEADSGETFIPICGNGLLEKEEKCECYKKKECEQNCCDWRTCQTACQTVTVKHPTPTPHEAGSNTSINSSNDTETGENDDVALSTTEGMTIGTTIVTTTAPDLTSKIVLYALISFSVIIGCIIVIVVIVMSCYGHKRKKLSASLPARKKSSEKYPSKGRHSSAVTGKTSSKYHPLEPYII